MNTPRTNAIYEGINTRAAFRGFVVPQDVTDLTDHARSLETQVQELREALKLLLPMAEKFCNNAGCGADGRGLAEHSVYVIQARAILEKTK